MKMAHKHAPRGGAVLFGTLACAALALADEPGTPRHEQPAAKKGGMVVTLCDGQTSTEVEGLKPGQRMGRKQAQAVSDQLMAEWREKNPGAHWDEVMAQARQAPPPPSQGQGTGHALPSSASATGASQQPQPG